MSLVPTNTPRQKIAAKYNPRITRIRKQKAQLRKSLKNANTAQRKVIGNKILAMSNQIALLTVQRNRELQRLR